MEPRAQVLRQGREQVHQVISLFPALQAQLLRLRPLMHVALMTNYVIDQHGTPALNWTSHYSMNNLTRLSTGGPG